MHVSRQRELGDTHIDVTLYFNFEAQSKERNKTRELSVSSLFVVILTGTRPAV